MGGPLRDSNVHQTFLISCIEFLFELDSLFSELDSEPTTLITSSLGPVNHALSLLPTPLPSIRSDAVDRDWSSFPTTFMT